MLKILKYYAYVELIENLVAAFKAIRKGARTEASIRFRKDGRSYLINVTSD